MTVLPHAVLEIMQRKASNTHLVAYWALSIRAALASPTKTREVQTKQESSLKQNQLQERGKRRQLVNKVYYSLFCTVISLDLLTMSCKLFIILFFS